MFISRTAEPSGKCSVDVSLKEIFSNFLTIFKSLEKAKATSELISKQVLCLCQSLIDLLLRLGAPLLSKNDLKTDQ